MKPLRFLIMAKAKKAEEPTKEENKNIEKSDRPSDIKDSGVRHKVQPGESIGSLANKYDVKVSEIIELNKLKRKELWLNETIKIPDNGKGKKVEEKPKSDDKTKPITKGKTARLLKLKKPFLKKIKDKKKLRLKQSQRKKATIKKTLLQKEMKRKMMAERNPTLPYGKSRSNYLCYLS